MDNNNLVEAEKSVLGGMIVNDQIYYKVIGLLVVDDFSIEEHRIIFKDLSELRDKEGHADSTTFLEYLKQKKDLNTVGGIDYIVEICSIQPLDDEIIYYVNIVKDKSLIRKLFSTIDGIKNEYNTKSIDDISDFVGNAEKEILNVTEKRRVSEFRTTDEVIKSLITNIKDEKQKRIDLKLSAPYLNGYPTGYVELDKLTGGFQTSDLIILAARPSVGKTALALNFAQRVARQNRTVGIFSLEMSAEQILLRILSEESRLPTNTIRGMDFDSIHDQYNEKGSDAYNLNAAIMQLQKERLLIDDTSALKLIDIKSKARKLKAKYPDLALIVIDYIGLITSPSKANQGNRQQEVSEITRNLKFMARDLQVPVLALCQLSRSVEARKDHEPTLSDLRESGSIEQDADQVMFIYRKDYYKDLNENNGQFDSNGIPKDPPLESEASSFNSNDNNISNVTVIVAKNRNGKVGNADFVFYKDVCRFESVADPNEVGMEY